MLVLKAQNLPSLWNDVIMQVSVFGMMMYVVYINNN